MFLPEKGATYTLSLNREVSNGASIDLDEDFIRERIVPLN
jgi:hypothetical protein